MSRLLRFALGFAVCSPLAGRIHTSGAVRSDAQPGSYEWTRVRPPGSGSWQESWTAGTVPLALKPLVGPDSMLWMVGGRGVWRSTDGVNWSRVTSRPPWGDRYGATAVSFRGELWAFGGEEHRVKQHDVYRSSDGARWTRAADAPWSARRWHTATVFRNQVWILGGSDSGDRNDVWVTADGTTWRLVAEHAPWNARGGHAAVVWRDQLCVIGGLSGGRRLTDVWCSRDGRAWSKIGDGGWSPRIWPGVLVFDDKLWLLGGSAEGAPADSAWLNDVRVSSDGAQWSEQWHRAPWSPRSPEYSVVFSGRLWIYGGKGIEATGRGGFATDVWTLRKSQ